MSNSLRPHGLWHTRLPSPSLSPRVCWDSYPLSQWCYPSIPSSVVPFSSCPQSFQASGSFPVSQLFTSGSQSTGTPTSNENQGLLSSGWTPLPSPVSEGLKHLQHHALNVCVSAFSFPCVYGTPWWCWHCYCELKGYGSHTLAQERLSNCCSAAGDGKWSPGGVQSRSDWGALVAGSRTNNETFHSG